MYNNYKAKKIATQLLAQANIKINGSQPWDFQVKNPAVFNRILTQGSLGLGESYMDGWWEAEKLDEFFNKLLSAKLPQKIKRDFKLILRMFVAKIINLQSKRRSFIVGQKHYDLGNSLYTNM